MAGTIARICASSLLLALMACQSTAVTTRTSFPAALTWSSAEHRVALIWEDDFIFEPQRAAYREAWNQKFSDAFARKGISLLSINPADEPSSDFRLCLSDIVDSKASARSDINCEDVLGERFSPDYVLEISTRKGVYRPRGPGESLGLLFLEIPAYGPCVLLGPIPSPCDSLPDPTTGVSGPDSIVGRLHETRTKTVVWEKAIKRSDWQIRDGLEKLLAGSPF